MKVQFWNTTSQAAPTGTWCLRVPQSDWNFLLREAGKDTVFVSYAIRLDPGGWLPDWIVGVFVRDAPYSTLLAFQAQVLKTRGQ